VKRREREPVPAPESFDVVLPSACRPPRAGLSPCASLYLTSSGDRCREDLLDRLKTPGGRVSPGGAYHESVNPIAQLAVIGATTKNPMTAPYVAPVLAASHPRRSRTSRDLPLRLCDTASPALPRYDTACPVSLRHRLPCLVTTPPALPSYDTACPAAIWRYSRCFPAGLLEASSPSTGSPGHAP